MTVAIRARTLFDQHLFTRRTGFTSGITGIFNDPRTFGLGGEVSF